MVKAKKKEPLVVGQHVWIETISYFFKKPRAVREYEVVEANRNSAYIVRMDNLEKFKADPAKEKWSKTRVEQKNHNIKCTMIGYGERLWLTKEDFELSVKLQQERAELLKLAREKVDGMSLQQLRQFMEVE